MENNAKALVKFKVNNIHSHPLMDRADHVILEGDHDNRARLALRKSVLAVLKSFRLSCSWKWLPA